MTDTTLQRPRGRIRVEIRDIASYFDNMSKLMGIAERHDVFEEVIIRQSSKKGVAYLYLPVNEKSDLLVEDYSKLEYVTSVKKGNGMF